MRGCLPRGILTISIDVDGDAGRAPHNVLPALEMLHKHQLPATWALADPASTLAERIVRDATKHEIGLLGDASWIGRAAGRGRFAHKLAERAQRAAAGGVQVTTLAVVNAHLGDQADLAIKHGITAVRHGELETKSTRTANGRALHNGLWNFPVGIMLPGASRWLPGGAGGGRVRSAVEHATSGRAMFHLVVDAGRLAARGRGALRVLDGVLRFVAGRRATGALDVLTMQGAVERLAGQYQAQPSRSILRAA